jgi:hypothetical protein
MEAGVRYVLRSVHILDTGSRLRDAGAIYRAALGTAMKLCQRCKHYRSRFFAAPRLQLTDLRLAALSSNRDGDVELIGSLFLVNPSERGSELRLAVKRLLTEILRQAQRSTTISLCRLSASH